MQPKNIIVCADGTGNKGGYSPDSNVYKVYKAVNKNFKGKCKDKVSISEQILFYDNGIGTTKNKILRTLGGAFGFGFKRNVCDLYKFLARNYEPGDRIFFFGFSRGASTVRACNGMISKCGLAKGKKLRNRELDALVDEAFDVYMKHQKDPLKAQNFNTNSDNSFGAVPIKFLGVWDTVVALGFPNRTDVTGPVTVILNTLFLSLEKVSDFFFPHSFYHYKLTDNVEYACQALAIDDERTAFWPYVWKEKDNEDAKDREKNNVEQVWFSGMHSNVGGGYARAGMACIPLYWMMKRAESHGLEFTTDTLQQACNGSHIHGRMYNSRDGFGIMYRYHPREIEKLCEDKLLDNIKIHCSVIDRINHRTANYTPGYIPASFDVVDSEIPSKVVRRNPGMSPNWKNTRQLINRFVLYRKRMYGVMLASLFTILGFAIYFKNSLPETPEREGFWGGLANFFDYFLPDFFDGLINVAIVQKPYLFISAVFLLFIYLFLRNYLYEETVKACETLRHSIIDEQIPNAKKAIEENE